MITPAKSKWNSAAFVCFAAWLFVWFPLHALNLVVAHQIDDDAFRGTLQYVGGAGGLVTVILQGLNMWCNSP